MKRYKDLTGNKYGSLTAIEPLNSENGMMRWKFLCECGNTHEARGNSVTHQSRIKKDPRLPSCGCVELEYKTKHGYRTSLNTHPLYKVYRNMLNRCYNKKSPSYKHYGEKGVTVCEEWRNSPESFISWALKNGYKKGLHLDKDYLSGETKIYSPSTCHFIKPNLNVSQSTNRNSKSAAVKIPSNEIPNIINSYLISNNMSEIARTYNVDPSTIRRILILEGYVSGKVKGVEYKAYK